MATHVQQNFTLDKLNRLKIVTGLIAYNMLLPSIIRYY